MKILLDDFNLIRIFGYNNKKLFFNNKEIKFLETKNKFNLFLIDEINDFSVDYYINDEEGNKYLIEIGLVTTTQRFNEMFQYHDTLGYIYTPSKTTFYVYSPVAKEIYLVVENYKKYKMEKHVNGSWKVEVCKNLHLKRYYYLVRVNNRFQKATDPYSLTGDNNYSVVIDFNKTIPIDKTPIKQDNICDTIIYEGHVRDLTINLDIKNKGNFLGLIEKVKEIKKPIVDYIKYLGVTHLQLQPVTTFAGVNSKYKDSLYNWGYNPLNYFNLEGWYSSKPNSYIERINEFKKVINYCHKIGLGIILDVVYNHVYSKKMFNYDILVPNYFFRFNEDFNLENGSGCGNEIESRNFMVRRLIVDSLSFFAREFQIDGFRFDLFGLIDVVTSYQIEGFLTKINPSILIYGEGWSMGNTLVEEERVTIKNSSKVLNVSLFNDQFRKIIKGNKYFLGFEPGNGYNLSLLCNSILGSSNKFVKPTQSINYVECHDDKTIYDQINDIINYNEDSLKNFLELALSLVIISQGVPFIHAGQEFYLSKKGIRNSYCSPDEINGIKWDFNSESISKLKELIQVRKKYKLLRMDRYSDNIKTYYNSNNKNINYVLYDENTFLNIYVKNDYYRNILVDPGNLVFNLQPVEIKANGFEISKPGLYIFEKK